MNLRSIVAVCTSSAFVLFAAGASASASTKPASPSSHAVLITREGGSSNVKPLYEKHLHDQIKCANWKGTLEWGDKGAGHKGPTPAFIQVSGEIHDTCSTGWAKLYLHWDTVDNPKNKLVRKVARGGTARTPYHTDDYVQNYKDIYLELCSRDDSGHRCGPKMGPGA